MRFVLPVVAALLPIVIAPGFLFYFDVTPKLVILLIGLGIALILWRGELPLDSRLHRIFLLLLGAQAVSLVVSTAASVYPALSLNGGNWRRFGLVSQVAILLFTTLVAAECASDRDRVTVYLKAIMLGGIPVALYAVLEYFGWDPWLPRQAYHAGEATWSIVRPPSTMGHASYLATYLLFVIFAAAGLIRARTWRLAAAFTAVLAFAAIIVSGTRAALLGLVVGAVVILWRTGRPSRITKIAAAALLLACLAFYLSPAGQGLRNRVNWVSNEPLGGARPLLWRDSLRMSLHHPALGYGPETFIREFPRQESLELARAYPDFLHESPHNIFLDALIAQGIPGLLVLAALCIWGLWQRPPDLCLLAAIVAVIVAQLFTVFIVPTAFFFYLTLALMTPPGQTRRVPLARMAACCCAVLLTVYALRLFVADRALSAASAALGRGDLAGAIVAHQRVQKWALPGSNAELYYSRRLVDLAGHTNDLRVKAQAVRQAANAALNATRTSEEPPNAWYNLAAFLSMTNAPADVERSLREAIQAAPNWYKPHWVLAQLLVAEQRLDEARSEAEIAVKCNFKEPELLHTLENIRAAQRQKH
jgi:O-antigen ligase